MAFLEARVGNHPPKVAREVQKILYRNELGVRLRAHNAPDGEEAHNLLWAWEQIAPLFADVEDDPTWQAVMGLRTLLRTLYSPILVVPRSSCRRVAAAFQDGNTVAGSRGFTIYCSSKRTVVPCSSMWGGIGCCVGGRCGERKLHFEGGKQWAQFQGWGCG